MSFEQLSFQQVELDMTNNTNMACFLPLLVAPPFFPTSAPEVRLQRRQIAPLDPNRPST